MAQRDIEVYLFLGFLDSGKTKFIQETLEDARMQGDDSLLLVCEEGETEYDPSKFAIGKVAVVTLEGQDELTQENLEAITKKHKPLRVFVEYNGMWLLQSFFDAMPESWVIVQMMSFFDSTTFLQYNRNMRQLVYDKIYMTQMTVFNRFERSYDMQAFHKVVRAISRQPDIVYEDPDGNVKMDDIEDPLPFDVNAPVVEIEDKDFAYFFRDMYENGRNYIGKTVKFKGMAAVIRKADPGTVLIGRHIMTCCEADIAYDGFVLKHNNLLQHIKTQDWIEVTAKVSYGKSSAYKDEGPILSATSLEMAEAPEEAVATYY